MAKLLTILIKEGKMKRLILTTLLLTLIALLIAQAQAQAPTYKWGLPQTVQTNVTQPTPTPFPDIRPRQHRSLMQSRISEAATRPMPHIRKVSFPACEQVLMPAPLMPIYAPPSWPVYAVVDVKVLWQKATISFHTDQLSLAGTNPVGEFGITLVKPDIGKVRYSFIMQQMATESIIPQSALTISNTVFVATSTPGQPAAAPSTIPIKIDWEVGPSHRIDAVCLRVNQFPTNFWLSPAIVANWMDFKVTGTTTSGTQMSASETFQKFYWGAGAELVYQQNNARLSALLAGSDRYLMADTALAVALGTNFDLTVGWQGKQVKMERDTVARLTALTCGVAVRF